MPPSDRLVLPDRPPTTPITLPTMIDSTSSRRRPDTRWLDKTLTSLTTTTTTTIPGPVRVLLCLSFIPNRWPDSLYSYLL